MISHEEAEDIIKDENSLIFDIRDEISYNDSHYSNAVHLTNQNFNSIVEQSDKEKTILVYCYKGISSQNVAQHLCNLGFKNVYSLNGGYKDCTIK
tara:strand:+ start:910 stop:1194 length:285 start_codon:yes stop_codon:yes gene_type:complete